jgi:protein-tyrosine phosphatase
MKGIVKIYESSSPDSFNLSSPIAEVDIGDGFKDVYYIRTAQRSYFKLVFNNKVSTVTAERSISMQELFNFRDLGGYYNEHGKQVRWGKIYRSSTLAYATFQDAIGLKNLGIQTVFDLRTDWERYQAPSRYIAPQMINLPLRGNPTNVFLSRILSGRMRAGDVRLYEQDKFAFMLDNNSEYFTQMFDLLLDEKNYPVLFCCSWGNDRNAVTSALILAALGIDLDQIIDDYMTTNQLTNVNLQIPDFDVFSQAEDIQQTLTALVRVHRGTIIYSFDRIINDFGTLDNYFDKELNLTPAKREKLKEMFLY